MTDQTAPDDAKPPAESLFDRLGGVYAIAAAVDDFIDRVMNNPKLNANPAVDEAHHRVHPAGFKYLVTEQVCWASGGPQQYTGRSMVDSHKELNITESQWRTAHRFTTDRQSLCVPSRRCRQAVVVIRPNSRA